jgi:hypothetical protein
MKINDIIKLPVYGKLVSVRVIAIHAFGTIDVQRADGSCFRITGLSLNTTSGE